MTKLIFPHQIQKARILKFEKKAKLSPLNTFAPILPKPKEVKNG